MNLNQTTTIPSGKDIQRKWFVLDASGQTLGRLASHAASFSRARTTRSTRPTSTWATTSSSSTPRRLRSPA